MRTKDALFRTFRLHAAWFRHIYSFTLLHHTLRNKWYIRFCKRLLVVLSEHEICRSIFQTQSALIKLKGNFVIPKTSRKSLVLLKEAYYQ